MTDFLDVEISKRSLAEMAPRMKILSKHSHRYVRELEEWQAKAREYGDRYVRPIALEIDRKCAKDPTYFDWDLIKKSTPYGFLSMFVPKGAGGGGQLSTALAIVMEELSAACSGVANVFGANGLGVSGFLLGMDFYHYDRCLAELAEGDKKGEPVIFAAAITEPLAGSDVEDREYLKTAKLMSEAKPVSGGYLLNGRKVFISNGSVAKYTMVVAPTNKSRPVDTQSGFLVTMGDKGYSIGRVEEKMGMKACPAAEQVFEDCFIPKENLAGREGEGVRFTEIVLGASRGPVGAIATGVARGAFERLVAYAKSKKSGGRWLIEHQWVQIRLADMARRIHLARQAYLDACMSFDFTGIPKLMKTPTSRLILDALPQEIRKGDFLTKLLRSAFAWKAKERLSDKHVREDDLRHIQQYSSLAKITGSDVAVGIAAECLQVAGLESSLHRLELEKIYRDAKLTQIYEGTNQLNRHNLFKNYFPEEAAHGS
ncbi:MAG: acyl-CoA dehydrogenase family protein [Desulfobacterales bacterium]|uniref:Acyl-CoA dehydrogenase family protein n=1 Tax=Candidatus Desulfatibia vada TaxID=2841696 RepID=A0A8J6P613_9BACT|nr:acyl-CoA dehydrogenase family protein [Candidatus Desulfatibia vada]